MWPTDCSKTRTASFPARLRSLLFGNIDSYNFYSWSETAAFFNSSLNPLVCVWRVRAIRKVIAEVFSKKSQRKDAFLVKFRKITPSCKNGEENELAIMIEP